MNAGNINDLSFLNEDKQIEKSELQELVVLCDKLRYVEKEIQKYEDYLATLKNRKRKLSSEEIPNFLLTKGISSLTLENGLKISIKEQVYISLPKKDLSKRKSALKWIIEKGGANIIKNEVRIEDPENRVLKLLKDNNVLFNQFQDIHSSTIKAWISRKLGVSKNSIQEIELSEIPNELNVYIDKQTIIK
ncbi:MAG: hypothetical protein P8Y70_00200 [Candidatus Lokiarchaeota archaeon]